MFQVLLTAENAEFAEIFSFFHLCVLSALRGEILRWG